MRQGPCRALRLPHFNSQSPSPALHTQSRMAASSSSGRDPPWIVQTRARQMSQRRSLGPPGAGRWKAIHKESADAEQGNEMMADPSAAMAAHELLRHDLSTSLPFHEPQADTMLIHGRPTQVFNMNIYLFLFARSRARRLLYVCTALSLQSDMFFGLIQETKTHRKQHV